LATFVCAIATLLILAPPAAYSQTKADSVQASIEPTAPGVESPAAPVRIVQMNDDQPMYQPSSIVITAGQTVEWHNNGQVIHSVVDDARRALRPDDALLPAGVDTFNSGGVMPGGTYRHRFMVPGRYRYFCMSHEIDDMVGEVIVRPAPSGTEPLISQAKSQPIKNPGSAADPPVPDP
jgi:plastocyanin